MPPPYLIYNKHKRLNAYRKWVVLLILFHKGKTGIYSINIFTSLAKISYVNSFSIPLQQLNYEADILAWMLAPLPAVGADFTLLAGKALEHSELSPSLDDGF